MLLIKQKDGFKIFEPNAKLLIETQFEYENMLGDNCAFLAASTGAFPFFRYFMSLAHEKKYRDLIAIQMD